MIFLQRWLIHVKIDLYGQRKSKHGATRIHRWVVPVHTSMLDPNGDEGAKEEASYHGRSEERRVGKECLL